MVTIILQDFSFGNTTLNTIKFGQRESAHTRQGSFFWLQSPLASESGSLLKYTNQS
jgi:hypothetical protein